MPKKYVRGRGVSLPMDGSTKPKVLAQAPAPLHNDDDAQYKRRQRRRIPKTDLLWHDVSFCDAQPLDSLAPSPLARLEIEAEGNTTADGARAAWVQLAIPRKRC